MNKNFEIRGSLTSKGKTCSWAVGHGSSHHRILTPATQQPCNRGNNERTVDM
jgi:hypothetical protein